MATAPVLHWIDGEWCDTGIHKTAHNPATGESIGTYADGGIAEAQQAIAAARRAFTTSAWRHDRQLRAKALNEMADAFERHTPALIECLVRENGKPNYEADFEVTMVPSKLRYFASLVRTQTGRALQPADGKLSVVVREPIGVAGIIVPWNSPVVLLIRSLAPALAVGATAVAKMPAQTALTNALVAKVLSEVKSLPRGVVNLFTESGAEGARCLVDSPDVPVISFTGSTEIGRRIAEAGGRGLKRLNLELGGKSPMIVFDDADLERLVPTLEKGVTVFAGQFCMTGARILVQRGIAEQVRQRLAQRLEQVRVGPGDAPDTDMGPLIDQAGVAKVDACVERAIAQGARVLVRGGPARDGALQRGAFYRPTLLEVQDTQMEIVQHETFGPVATIEVFDTEAQAVAMANATEYGLAASVWTRDVERPWRIGKDLGVGTVWINEWAVVHDEAEEGGQKQSGLGRLNGPGSLDVFTEFKHYTLTSGSLAA